MNITTKNRLIKLADKMRERAYERENDEDLIKFARELCIVVNCAYEKEMQQALGPYYNTIEFKSQV